MEEVDRISDEQLVGLRGLVMLMFLIIQTGAIIGSIVAAFNYDRRVGWPWLSVVVLTFGWFFTHSALAKSRRAHARRQESRTIDQEA